MRALLIALCVALAPAMASAQTRPATFVDARTLVPGLAVDMRYHGSENFVGRPIAGYEEPLCLLTRQAATALARVQEQLATFNLGLKVYDCYRPARAVADFAAWARDPNDQARREDFYPNVDKSRLFELGYIAERSGHSRGSTVDLTLIDLPTGNALDMGGRYDLFDTSSWPSEAGLEPQERANRALLAAVMRANGFRPYDKEWWHFTLSNEPYRNTYFDFPVRR